MTFYLTIHIVVCVLLIAVILFQDGKAGGLTSVADTSQAVFGAKGAASFLTKLTSILAVAFMISSLSLAYLSAPGNESIAAGHQPEKNDPSITSSETPEGTTTEQPAQPAATGGVPKIEKQETFKGSELPPEVREKLGVDKPADQPPAEKKDEKKDN